MSTDAPADDRLPPQVTAALARWNAGEPEATEHLLSMVYPELRRLAGSYLRRQRADHTLQPTALVHEAYLRLADKVSPAWRNRTHFFAVAAKVMRGILVDHARARTAAKRGGGTVLVPLEEATTAADPRAADLLALNDALERLATFDSRKARIVELRFFGGLNIEETAGLLGVSVPTIVNDTRKARAWLLKEVAVGQAV